MVLGIDLGTCNTLASTIVNDGSTFLIPDTNDRNVIVTPSVVLIDGNKAFAGNFAENLFQAYPDKELICFFKRYFGTQQPVYIDDNRNAWFSETLAALILKKVMYDASMQLPDGIKKTVITVPAHYNDVQRKSVIEAARLADFDLSAILEEPVAAALFYSNGHTNIDEEIILVYDFGGGTFDLTLITKTGNQMHVIAKDGITNVGGKEFDEIVSNNIRTNYEKIIGQSFPGDKLSQNRLRKISEKIKIQLHDTTQQNINHWLLFGKHAFECNFIVSDYAEKANNLILQTEHAVTRCLRSLGMQWKDVNKVIMIGGTSSSKIVHRYWQQKTDPATQQLICHQPLTSVTQGAALYAESLLDSNSKMHAPIDLKTVSTYNIGLVQNKQIDLLIHRNSPLPVSAKRIFRINPIQTTEFSIGLCQYWDAENDVFLLGDIRIGQFPFSSEFLLELFIENRANGTIGVKAKNADTGKDIKFDFVKKQSEHTYDSREQKTLLESVYLNNYY